MIVKKIHFMIIFINIYEKYENVKFNKIYVIFYGLFFGVGGGS